MNNLELINKKIFLDRLPSSEMYYRSYMHKEQIQFVITSPRYEFVISMSTDGVIKFWHVFESELEAIKTISTHSGPFQSYSITHDEEFFATGTKNGRIFIFRIQSFELISKFDYHTIDSINLLFINDPKIPLYQLCLNFSSNFDFLIIDPFEMLKKENEIPNIIKTLKIHKSLLSCFSFSNNLKISISIDENGIIEFWDCFGNIPKFDYNSRFDTDLFLIPRLKLKVISISISNDGNYFALCCSDWTVRIFNILTGKIIQTIKDPIDNSFNYGLDEEFYLNKILIEKKYRSIFNYFNVNFDESNSIIIIPSIFGIGYYSIFTGQLLRFIGRVEKNERFNSIASLTSKLPMIILTSFEKQRFFIFTNKSPNNSKRDIFNEKIIDEKIPIINKIRKNITQILPKIAILHTTMGSIKIELFQDKCPLSVENFVVHSRRGFFDNIKIHRVVKDFCIQTGDPTGSGIGGESIWGGTFEDESLDDGYTFDNAGMVGMANNGKNTNRSQFFITTIPSSFLNGKHTCFAKVIEGMDNIRQMELVDVDPYHHPKIPIFLVNVTFCS